MTFRRALKLAAQLIGCSQETAPLGAAANEAPGLAALFSTADYEDFTEPQPVEVGRGFGYFDLNSAQPERVIEGLDASAKAENLFVQCVGDRRASIGVLGIPNGKLVVQPFLHKSGCVRYQFSFRLNGPGINSQSVADGGKVSAVKFFGVLPAITEFLGQVFGAPLQGSSLQVVHNGAAIPKNGGKGTTSAPESILSRFTEFWQVLEVQGVA